MTTSIQRWVYAHGETVPDALCNLADNMERETIPADEWLDDSSTQVVTLLHDDGFGYVAGACLNYAKT